MSGTQSEPSQKPIRIVTQTRPKTYYGERMNPETKKFETVVIGTGSEIVEEKLVLPAVAQQYYQGTLNVQEQNAQKNSSSTRPSEGFGSRIKTVKKV